MKKLYKVHLATTENEIQYMYMQALRCLLAQIQETCCDKVCVYQNYYTI